MKCILQQSVTEGLRGIVSPRTHILTGRSPLHPCTHQVLTLIKYS